MRVWRGGMEREEWRKGGGMTWIFKPKRQTVTDKKTREIRNRKAGNKIELELVS